MPLLHAYQQRRIGTWRVPPDAGSVTRRNSQRPARVDCTALYCGRGNGGSTKRQIACRLSRVIDRPAHPLTTFVYETDIARASDACVFCAAGPYKHATVSRRGG